MTADVTDTRHAPLTGRVVVSLAEQYPGPYATMLLADLGADVTMVERPGGEPTRRHPALFGALNRSKRSVTLDLKSEDGRAVLESMLAGADVLLEGFRPGVMERMGFAPERLRREYPQLVIVSISSYGQTGPDREQGAHDLALQGRAGLLTGTSDVLGAVPTADLVSGVFAALGAVSALVARGDHGDGTHVDVSMFDCLLAWQAVRVTASLNGEVTTGYPPREPAYGVFRCADGRDIVLAVAGEDHQWSALCDELDLFEARGYRTAEREQRSDELRVLLGEALARRRSDQVLSRLEAARVSCGPVKDPAEVMDDEQVQARNMVVRTVPSQRRVVRQPLLFDGEALTSCVDAPAPNPVPPGGARRNDSTRHV
ncbi:CoA:oxalate CoA-transferase [Thermomonospora echinospora]|uniref:CoA:oxalate CoA-transferase n=1 Tax=Thermomonospora echinospora TaxID=1992 RepID=A0A1H6ALN5_9ACTN|nr:CoA transferase [Thermomonospora echinospora]SEG49643.1 CoA:oxalate CoA-transferase [Thermomonospora echinospora]